MTDNFGRPSHYYETLPFGEMMVEHNQSANVPSGVGYDNKYKFNGKELDDATQMYYYGARYYDPRISIFVSVDPLAEKTMTPYQYVRNNPIMFTDPTGMEADGTFIDENGREIGNDGIDDGKVYVIKTTDKGYNNEVPSAGISKGEAKSTENFIKKNTGNTEAFKNNSIAYDNSVEIEGSSTTRQKMVDIINQDNGAGGTADANNREYGGMIDFNGNVSQSPAGAVENPSKVSAVYFGFFFDDSTKSTFHSHPSGFIESGTKSSGNTIGYGTYTKDTFEQAPSQLDLKSSRHNVNYVFGRGNGKVYMYNSTGVIATLPVNRFVNFKK